MLCTVPPDDTLRLPPLKTVENSNAPPDSTSTVPPAIPVPEPPAPETTPPDDTVSVPPANIVTSLVMVPATFNAPPLETTMLLAVPPDEILRLPPLRTVANSNVPPDDTSTVPLPKMASSPTP